MSRLSARCPSFDWAHWGDPNAIFRGHSSRGRVTAAIISYFSSWLCSVVLGVGTDVIAPYYVYIFTLSTLARRVPTEGAEFARSLFRSREGVKCTQLLVLFRGLYAATTRRDTSPSTSPISGTLSATARCGEDSPPHLSSTESVPSMALSKIIA